MEDLRRLQSIWPRMTNILKTYMTNRRSKMIRKRRGAMKRMSRREEEEVEGGGGGCVIAQMVR
jgi:hypothetical protein